MSSSKSTVVTRKDMKEPDKFQEAASQAATWVASRKKHVILAGAVAVAVMLLLLAVTLVQGQREQKAGAAGADLLATVAADIAAVPVPGQMGLSFPTEEAKQRAVLTAAERVISQHSGTGPADLAQLAKGDAHYKLREWDAAKDAYEKYLSGAGKSDSLRFGALEGLALVAEAKGDLEGAAKAYERMASDAPSFGDRADLERARVLGQAGKADEAKKVLEGFGAAHPKSSLAGEAARQLAKLGGTK